MGCAVERSVSPSAARSSSACQREGGREYAAGAAGPSWWGPPTRYEWSFVAVPAQRNAGVMKHMRMEQEAALGRKYLESLRGEVARLGGLAGLGLEHAVLRGIADKLGYDELLALKGALERQAERVFPVETQLRYGGGRENDGVRDGAFLIERAPAQRGQRGEGATEKDFV